MDNLIILITLGGIAALGIMSPGPDFIAVTHSSVTKNKRYALAVAAGVVVGNGVWAGAALFGVGTLFVLFPTFFIVFKVLGGSYLMWMGFRMIRHANQPFEIEQTDDAKRLGGFVKGFSTTFANPKAAIYYASALTAVAPVDASFGLLVLMVVVVLIIAAFWFTAVVFFLSTPTASSFYMGIKIYLESLFGSLIMIFGLRQILSR